MAKLGIKRPKSLTDLATERIRQAIIDAELPLGGEISELTLAEDLGVSRTPIREALSILQGQGMVTVVPQRGSYVFFPTEQDLVDMCEYRIIIETRAVMFAMGRMREATIESMATAMDAMRSARQNGDAIAYSRADTAFHDSFFRNCNNRYLQEGHALVAGKFATLRTHVTAPLPGEQDRSFVEHGEIFDNFVRGDAAAIEPILTTHILRTRQSYLSALKMGAINNASEPGGT